MKELEFLEKQNVSPELIKRAEEFRQAYPVKDEVGRKNYKAYRDSLLWKGDPGDGDCSHSSGSEPASDRTEGNRKEYSG